MTGSTEGLARPAVESEPIERRLRAAGLPPLRCLAWVEVDAGVLEANARLLRSLLPDGTRLGLVVKANGYGHGLAAGARVGVAGGAEVLLVATLDEALVLRKAGIGERIVVLYPVPADGIPEATVAGVELVVADAASLAGLVGTAQERAARVGAGLGASCRVHLAIDSGMSRGGFPADAAVEAAATLATAPGVELVGAWSHLASPELPDFVAAQAERFEAAVSALRGAGHPVEAHLAATGGLFGTAPLHDLVRVGLAYYGVMPPELHVAQRASAVAAALRPAMSVRARPVAVNTLPAGSEVGYGGTWRAERESTIATLPIGYADGWTRLYSPGAYALVGGRRAPLVGRVSSDAIAVDITDVGPLAPDAEFVLLGEQDGERIDALELAALRRSIAWEVLDAFGERLARVYVRDERPVAVLPPYGALVEAPAGLTNR
ncbi:MAG TPA: alanine racemase [Candidatus Dormibacteraeota bacterium]|nr:alanine racemase [Candidatus Dormibacteraeota bacterium]